ncbi:MAG: hypothetical protein E7604_13850 [Ruminococcaceae bacterium]|nr:hypothetical protein [Oscillospiraceae bacterium]
MKLIHTADWHLASPMECRLSKEKAELRRRELLSQFADMVTYAKEHSVDAVLLCGDLSDDGVLPHETQDYLLSLIGDASSIRFFMIAGNHDRWNANTVGGCLTRSGRQIPDNLTVFGDTWGHAAVSDCVSIWGRSLTGKAIPPEIPTMRRDCYNIVMLHGEISESSAVMGGEGECIPLGALRGRDIDYLALGHEHAFRHKKLDARGTWCYPGCPAGRGFDECGQHGFVLLTLDGNHCTGASFVPFAKRTLHDLRLDVTSIGGGLYEAEQALGSLVRDIPRADLVRVTLCGKETAAAGLDLRYLEGRLAAQFFYAELCDRRMFSIDASDYTGDISLRGAFVRTVMEMALSDEERSAVLRCGLAALDGKNDDTFPREGGDTV